mmetsp:Transcript_13661/g.32431  ORF Transcript_13661/g.32431 Transcript_13661/m.32431 type:complete len:234 (+) Transcript_13661:295-996(+)
MVEREVGNGVVVCGRDRSIVRIHRIEKLLCGLAQDEVGLRVSRALLGVGALELAVGVVVGRAVGARQGSHVVAVLGLEGNKQLVLQLAWLRAAGKWGPGAPHRNIGQGGQIREAARKAVVLPVLSSAVLLMKRADVEHASRVGRVDGGPRHIPGKGFKRRVARESEVVDLLTARCKRGDGHALVERLQGRGHGRKPGHGRGRQGRPHVSIYRQGLVPHVGNVGREQVAIDCGE